MNFSDAERIVSFLESNKLRSTSPERADLIVLNTCGVRQTAENSVMSTVHRIRKNNPGATIVITGCLSKREDVQKKLHGKADHFFSITDFPKEVARILGNDACNYKNYLAITPRYTYQDHIWMPIMTGCSNYCSYCVVPYARGRECSRSPEEISQEIELASMKGTREVTLLGQNVNSYRTSSSKFKVRNFKLRNEISNFESEITFSTLLSFLAERFPDITFHFLTSHPKDFSSNLANTIAEHSNISKDIHLPLQSGSNRILKAMNRPYSKKDYLDLIQSIREIIPSARFSTDVIIGFPGETEKDFAATVDVFKKVGFYKAFLNKYSPRPGTAAFKLGDPIPWQEKKDREKILRTILMSHVKEPRNK